jgi:hypothetical protein
VPRRPRSPVLSRTLALLAILALCVLPTLPAGAQVGPLTASGTVTGDLKQGQTAQVRLVVKHTDGWQQVSDAEVDLVLRGLTLERMVFDPTHVSATIEGQAGPAGFGAPEVLKGTFFSINAANIGIAAQGQQATITFPLRVVATPPPGARLVYLARGLDGTVRAPRPLTPPIESDAGFSWGTLAVAIVAALFAGSFFGGTFASRRRPAPRPSVYATVQRRLDEEKPKPKPKAIAKPEARPKASVRPKAKASARQNPAATSKSKSKPKP